MLGVKVKLGKRDRSKEEGMYRWMVERQKDDEYSEGGQENRMMLGGKEDGRIEEGKDWWKDRRMDLGKMIE